MGVSDHRPGDDALFNCALQPESVNLFICNTGELTSERLYDWQNYLFYFGKTMPQTFKIDVNKKIHRLMRHSMDHILFLGFLHRASWNKTR